MKKNSKFFICILCIMLILTSNVYAYSIDKSNSRICFEDFLFNKLIFERMALLKEINIDEEKLLEIDNALKSIGCTFINDIDAKDKYPEIKAIVPGGTSVNWIERRISNYSYNGELYNIQKIVATANANSLCLKYTGIQQIFNSNDYTIGNNTLINAVTHYYGGLYLGNTTTLSLLNAITSNIGYSIDSNTTVRTPQTSYSWLMNQTVVFSYVRKENETDDEQVLTHISTGADVSIYSTIMGFQYNNGSWSSPMNISDHVNYVVYPAEFNSTFYAVSYYSAVVGAGGLGIGGPIFDAIFDTSIKGCQNSNVSTIYYCWPSYPSQVF